jgi:hypothetical protein
MVGGWNWEKTPRSRDVDVALLEFEDEARAFLDYCESNSLSPRRFKIIALSPKVQIFLKRMEIQYENTLPYFTNESHARLMLKSERWLRSLSGAFNLGGSTSIPGTCENTFLFYARFYINHFLWVSELISEIFRKNRVSGVYACAPVNDFCTHTPPLIHNSERFIGHIAKVFARDAGVEFVEIPLSPLQACGHSASLGASPLDTFEEFVYTLFRPFWMHALGKRKTILLASTGYNMRGLALGLKSRFPEVAWAEFSSKKPSKCMAEFFLGKALGIAARNEKIGVLDARLPISARRIFRRIPAKYHSLEMAVDNALDDIERSHSSLFTHRGVRFFDLFSEKIRKDLKFFILKLHAESENVEDMLEHLDARLLISPLARERSLMVAELCRKRGIPALMVSHGTLKRPENEIERIEYRHMGETLNLSPFYNYAAMQTPEMERHFQSYKSGNTPIRTGPLILAKTSPGQKEEIRKRILGHVPSGKKILLYPESVRERFSMRFQVFETFDEFVSSLSDLVNATDELGDAHLVVRLHPGRNLSADDMKLLLPESENITISSSKDSFPDILTVTDLLVNFSSTVIEEALQNSVPVLLYDRAGRYVHLPSQELRPGIAPKPSAVYSIRSPAYLEGGLRWIFDNHLDSRVPESIFNKYRFGPEHYANLVEFVSEKVKD